VPTPRTDRMLDIAALGRGVSAGFTILVIGGLAQPLIGQLLPPLGAVWLIVVAVAAFVVASWRIGDAPSPALQGAVAAVVSYLLVVPLVVMGTGGLDPQQVVLTLAVAAGTGMITGGFRSRQRGGEG